MRTDRLGYLHDLVTVLVAKELKLRYRGTLLGVLWSLASPITLALVLYVAFKRVLRLEIEDYPLFILSALFPWQWLANSIGAAPMLFFGNAALIKKLRFPRAALCVAVVLGDMMHFLVTIPVFAALLLLWHGRAPEASWLVGIPVLLVSQAALTLAAVLVIAAANAYLRDLEQLVRVFLLLLFYLTPVLFPAALVPGSLRWLLFANPVAPLVVSWRALLADGVVSPYVPVAAAYGAVALALALPLYGRMQGRLPELV